MNNRLTENITVLPSMCGADGRLSFPALFRLFMDMAAKHAQELGIGMQAMAEKDLFWLTVKTMIRAEQLPEMLDTVTVSTWPGMPEKLRGPRYYRVERSGCTIIEGKTEWAALERNTGRLRMVNEIYPAELELCGDVVCERPFSRISPVFPEEEYLGSYTVRSVDIDVGQHMNNAVYSSVLLGLLPLQELNGLNLREMEILYKSPCLEGETVRFYRRQTADGMELCGFTQGKPAVLAALRAK